MVTTTRSANLVVVHNADCSENRKARGISFLLSLKAFCISVFVAPCLLVGLLCALYCVLCAGEEPDSDEESGDGDGDDDDSSGENRVSTCLLQKGPQQRRAHNRGSAAWLGGVIISPAEGDMGGVERIPVVGGKISLGKHLLPRFPWACGGGGALAPQLPCAIRVRPKQGGKKIASVRARGNWSGDGNLKLSICRLVKMKSFTLVN